MSHLWEKEKGGKKKKKKGRREEGNRKGKDGRERELRKIGGKIRSNFKKK